jgi:DNA-binding Lrp family transcriptional regulator
MPRKRDKIDTDLLALLMDEARLSTSEIARRLGLARSTVNERIARLEEDRIILGYQAIVAADETLQETHSILYLRCDRLHCRKITEALRGYPEIRQCLSISGQFDLMCHTFTPCAEDIDALIEEIAQIPGILEVTTTVVLAEKFDRTAKSAGGGAVPLKLAS